MKLDPFTYESNIGLYSLVMLPFGAVAAAWRAANASFGRNIADHPLSVILGVPILRQPASSPIQNNARDPSILDFSFDDLILSSQIETIILCYYPTNHHVVHFAEPHASQRLYCLRQHSGRSDPVLLQSPGADRLQSRGFPAEFTRWLRSGSCQHPYPQQAAYCIQGPQPGNRVQL